jgi:hypothetical protein
LDISDFMIAVGSEEGEIGNFFKFLKKSLLWYSKAIFYLFSFLPNFAFRYLLCEV